MDNIKYDSANEFFMAPDHAVNLFRDEDHVTLTSEEQIQVESNISRLLRYVQSNSNFQPSRIRLDREKHIAFLRKGLNNLPPSICCLDASRAWLLYWTLHALEILDVKIIGEEASHIVNFLSNCQNEDGGFGGGPGQYSHLATTYAAVCALLIVGTEEAYKAINRHSLYAFLGRMKTSVGSFRMHEGGEADIRGAYCAVAVARMVNIVTEKLFDGTSQWLVRCQSYEGGFGGAPGLEAHGGYTFCGFAALTLLNSTHLCDTEALLRWATRCQMRYEGGFQGRTNKLVDGCYSFWQGGLFSILHTVLSVQGDKFLSSERWLFNQEALQEYLLVCCQHPKGGLIDKLGKKPDYYHTCYTLSGLSVAQHFTLGKVHKKTVVGNPNNELAPVYVLYNIGVESALAASQFFSQLPIPVEKN